MTNLKLPRCSSSYKTLRNGKSPPTISFISASLLMVHGHVPCCHYNSPDPVMCSTCPTIEKGFIDLLNPFSAKLTLTLHALKDDTFKPPNKIPQNWFVLQTIESILMLTLERTWKHYELFFIFEARDKHSKFSAGFLALLFHYLFTRG